MADNYIPIESAGTSSIMYDIAIVLLPLIVILLLLIIIAEATRKKSKRDKYYEHCKEINDTMGLIGIDNFDYCKVPMCGGNLLFPSKNTNLDDPTKVSCPTGYEFTQSLVACCQPVPPRESSADAMDGIVNFIQSNPLMSAVIAAGITKLGYKLDTAVGKAFRYVINGPEGRKAAMEAGGGVIDLAGKAMGEVGVKLGETEMMKGLSKFTGEAMEKVAQHCVVKQLGAKGATMIGALSVPVVGEALDLLMWGSMYLDFVDPDNFGQYLDNQEGVLSMRDQLEGKYILEKRRGITDLNLPKTDMEKSKDKGNIAYIRGDPPYIFTLDIISIHKPYSPYKDDVNFDTLFKNWQIIMDIGYIYKEANDSYLADVIKKNMDDLPEKDQDNLLELFTDIIKNTKNDEPSDITFPPDIVEKLVGSVGTSTTERDKYIVDYITNPPALELLKYDDDGIPKEETKPYYYRDYKKYLLIDKTGKMGEFGSNITLSREGKKLWDSIYKLSSNPVFTVFSQYYKTFNSEPRQGTARDHNVYDRDKSSREDLSDTLVFDMKTEKLPNEWLLISPLESIKTMCKEGMHMPSLTESLANMASQKLCEKKGHKYITGYCSVSKNFDQPSCISNFDDKITEILPKISEADKKKLSVIRENNKDRVLGIWEDAKCCKDGDYKPAQCDVNSKKYDDIDEITCKYMFNGKYEPPHCTEDKAGGTGLQDGSKVLIDWAGTKQPTNVEYHGIGTDGKRVSFPANRPSLLSVKDVPPGDYGVTFNEDTGICNYNKEYCIRMGYEYEEIAAPNNLTLHPDHKLSRCKDQSTFKNILSFIVGETLVKRLKQWQDKVVKWDKTGEAIADVFAGLTDLTAILRFDTVSRDVKDRVEQGVGDWTEAHFGKAFNKAGGSGTGSLAYALQHPLERSLHDITGGNKTAFDIGRAVDGVLSLINPF